jgi:hypothetical protein
VNRFTNCSRDDTTYGQTAGQKEPKMNVELMLSVRRRRSQGHLSAWTPVRPVASVPTLSPAPVPSTPALYGAGLLRK